MVDKLGPLEDQPKHSGTKRPSGFLGFIKTKITSSDKPNTNAFIRQARKQRRRIYS